MTNINVIVTNPNDVHRILKDFGTYRIENKKDHLVENDHFERKKRCRDHDLDGYNHVEDDSTDVVYRKKYKTPVNRRCDYLVQDNDHSRKIVSQSQKTITLEEFLEERNRLVMRLDKNSKKRLLETTHPPPPFYQPQPTTYSYHPVQLLPNTGFPTPYNMYSRTSQYSQVGVNPTDANANASSTFNETGHPEKSNTSPRQLELQLPDDSRSPPREVQRPSSSTTQHQHHSRQQQQKKKQQQQQYQQQQQKPYTRSQLQVRSDSQKSTNPDVSSPELFRGLMDEIGDIDEV